MCKDPVLSYFFFFSTVLHSMVSLSWYLINKTVDYLLSLIPVLKKHPSQMQRKILTAISLVGLAVAKNSIESKTSNSYL